MRLKNTATATTRTIKREPLFKQEPFGTRVLWLLSMLVVSVVYAWIIQRKGYYKSKYTHTVAHTPPSPSHTHTHAAHVCAYMSIYFLCASHLILLLFGWRRAWVIGSFYCRLVYFNFARFLFSFHCSCTRYCSSPARIRLLLLLLAVVVVLVDEANFNE